MSDEQPQTIDLTKQVDLGQPAPEVQWTLQITQLSDGTAHATTSANVDGLSRHGVARVLVLLAAKYFAGENALIPVEEKDGET